MSVTKLRKLVRTSGPFGLLLGACYILVRSFRSRRPLRVALIAAFAAMLLGGWLAVRRTARDSAPASGEAAPRYRIVDLGTAAKGVVAAGMNSAGDVAGVVWLSDKVWHAALWRGRKMLDLGTLGGSRSAASAINDAGEVVGWSETSAGKMLGFRWKAGNMERLESLDGGLSFARSLNARGDAVGFSTTAQSTLVACQWQGRRCRDLGVPSGYALSIAEDIDDQGLVVGDALDGDMERIRAFLWQRGQKRDLGTLGGKSSIAAAIGPSGKIVGASLLAGSDEELNACLWDSGLPRDMGRLPNTEWGVATGVNRAGDIVGASGVG